MRESIARRAALGTGLLVVGAVALFAVLQERDATGTEAASRLPAASTSVQDPAPAAVLDSPASRGFPPDAPPAEAVPGSDDTVTSADGMRSPDTAGPAPMPPDDQPDTSNRPVPSSDLLAAGERVYTEQRCAACHSIAGVGSPRSPLDGVGGRLTASEIRLWIVDPAAMRPGIRKPSFDHLPPEELEALVAFIQTLR